MLPTIRRAWEITDRASLLVSKRAIQRIGSFVRKHERSVCLLVAGVQRSGTNMVMDVLERSYATEVYHERDPRAFANYQLREEEVIQSLIAHSRTTRVRKRRKNHEISLYASVTRRGDLDDAELRQPRAGA